MTLAEQILDAWDESYSASIYEMVRTRGGWAEHVGGEGWVYFHLPDGSTIMNASTPEHTQWVAVAE